MGSWFSIADDVSFNFTETDVGSAPSVSNTVECAAELIKQHQGRVVFVTGAGISAHQLPTFRSDNNSGLWEAFAPPVLDKANFYEKPTPSWKLLANVRNMQVTRMLHPSLAHFVIHELLVRGIAASVITQNIDGLHSFASDVKKVIELHGAVADFGICEKCQVKRQVDNLKILEKQECPVCEVCHSVLKPPVAFFGDVIDHEKRAAAYRALSMCDVLVLVGTHCTVDPVLSMATEAKRSGCIVIEINLTPTPATGFVDVSLQGKADEVFGAMGKMIMGDVDWDHLNLDQWTPSH